MDGSKNYTPLQVPNTIAVAINIIQAEAGQTQKNTFRVTFAHPYFSLSLGLVGELLAMVVDPNWSSNKSSQESNHSTQTARNRPHLQDHQVLPQAHMYHSG